MILLLCCKSFESVDELLMLVVHTKTALPLQPNHIQQTDGDTWARFPPLPRVRFSSRERGLISRTAAGNIAKDDQQNRVT